MSAPAMKPRGSPSAGRTTRSRSRSRRLTRASGSVGPSNQITRLPVELLGQAAQRAQEQAQRAPLLLGAVDDAQPPSAARAPAPARRASAPGADQLVRRRGRSAPAARPVAPLLAVRASMRPKNISTSIRATWVESTRSAGSWKVATLREWEWRSAAEPGLGAKGSWTWTMSNGTPLEQLLQGPADVDRDRGGPSPRPAGKGDALPDRQHPRVLAAPAASPGRRRAALIARRVSRIAVRDSEGAAISTRWPRSASSSEVRRRTRRSRGATPRAAG